MPDPRPAPFDYRRAQIAKPDDEHHGGIVEVLAILPPFPDGHVLLRGVGFYRWLPATALRPLIPDPRSLTSEPEAA